MRVANATLMAVARATLMALGCMLLGHPAHAQSPVPLDGPSVYRAYCAACHGADGQGNGPAAAAMKQKPTDLTTIARNNGGTFPRRALEDMITHGDKLNAHGSKEMPTWGPVFLAVDTNDKLAHAHIYNLVTLLESIQVK
jgi:mono/diheme cytochrome c family protein